MRFVDEFRAPEMARVLARQIARLVDPRRHYKFMEVCGGHTHTIYKHGIEDYLPPNLTLVHGPGCPVCVIPSGRGSFLDAAARGGTSAWCMRPLTP